MSSFARSSIIGFYSGEIRDHRGRTLTTILSWDRIQLESVHDYIQWLFPLPERSPVNPVAPVLDNLTITRFAASADLRAALLQAFTMMIEFYGFRFRADLPPEVERAPEFGRAAANWLSPGNHNLLRITRILRSTRLLGLEKESSAFFRALEELYRTEKGRQAIGSVSFGYWQHAAGG